MITATESGPEDSKAKLTPQGLGDNPSLTRVRGYIIWTPSPYQGGWKGQVRARVCVFECAYVPVYAEANISLTRACGHGMWAQDLEMPSL